MRTENFPVKAIGGYFSLELPLHGEYHKDAIRLNTGRNCLEYILLSNEFKKIYIPYYTCEVILEPLLKLGIQYEFYNIDSKLEISQTISLKREEALLYTNYFGIKGTYVEELAQIFKHQLIIDNTQAFYDVPAPDINTFYSCRKFFGVPDGAYLYSSKKLESTFNQGISYDKTTFLTKRIDLGAEEGFSDYKRHDNSLIGLPIETMSSFTHRMMQSIDYEYIRQKRRYNFMYLHKYLQESNQFNIQLESNTTPMVYPYLTNSSNLRENLIQNRIYVAKYWPNVEDWTSTDSIEYRLTNNLIPLPIDQRYGEEEMEYIIEVING